MTLPTWKHPVVDLYSLSVTLLVLSCIATILSLKTCHLAEKRPRTEKSDTETEDGGEEGPSQSRYKKGHMTNINVKDSEEEAIMDFVKDTRSCTTRLMNFSRTKQGRNVSGRCSSTVASCLPRCARPGLSHKEHITAS